MTANHFPYQQNQLTVELLNVADIAAQVGTPLYIYSRNAFESHWKAFDSAFGDYPHLVCFAVKSNHNIAVLNVLARLGSGFDIVSQGELERVLAAGGSADKVVFSGVAKGEAEIARALEVGIRCFNVESIPELHRINRIAGEMGKIAPISLRVNPDVDAKTHPYISTGLKENKFGINIDEALDTYRLAASLPNLRVSGIDCHIGSQLTELQPFLDALERLKVLMRQLKAEGIALHHIDLGGGLGVTYTDETPPSRQRYVEAMLGALEEFHGVEVILEMGRSISANAGILVTKVEYLKQNGDLAFAIVNTGMNDMIRPALYEAYMQIVEVEKRSDRQSQIYNIVGPICESADFLGKQRVLSIAEGDLLAVRSAGAYGASMASTYNSHRRAAEVMVDGKQFTVIKARESYADLWRGEQILA